MIRLHPAAARVTEWMGVAAARAPREPEKEANHARSTLDRCLPGSCHPAMNGRLLTITAVAEGATGLALLVFPSLVVRLLLGAEISGIGMVMSRVAGLALIGLGIACLPGRALAGMFTYSALVATYLAFLGIAEGDAGLLLWPAVVVHVVLSVLLARALFKPDR